MDDAEKQRYQQVTDALARYQAKGSAEIVPDAMERVLETESDRALVTIIGSYIEDALESRLLSELSKGEENRRDLVRGPLRSVEHRIALALGMGILTERQAALVNLFRAMRNTCAHSRLDIDLLTPELRDAVALMMPDEILDEVHSGKHDETLRGVFVVAATLTLHGLQGGSDDELEALMERSLDAETKLVRADKLLLASLRERLKSKSAPQARQGRKG